MTKLRLISREQEVFESALRSQAKLFEQAHPDIELEFEFLPIHDHFERMIVSDGCFTGEADLFLCCTDWLPAIASRGGLKSLDEPVRKFPPEGWPDGWHRSMHTLNSVEGTLYGVPWHDGPEVLHYRSDLFEDQAEQTGFREKYGYNLKLPETWDQFVHVAEHFTRPEQELWGACEAGYTDGHNNVYDFLIQLWSRGGDLFSESFEPIFHSEIGIESLAFLRDLFHNRKAIPEVCLQQGSVECGDFYAQGHAAMSWNWIGFAAVCEIPQFSKIVGKNRCARIPRGRGGHVSMNVYWLLTIPTGSKNADAAYEFIRFVAGPERDKITSLSGANGTRLSTWRDPEIQHKFPYYAAIEDIHETTRTIPAIPEFAVINETLSHAIHSVIHGTPDQNNPAKRSFADPGFALQLAAQEARKILVQSGRLPVAG